MAVHIDNVARARLMPTSVEALLERIPLLAAAGQDEAVEQILFEVLLFLNAQISADIGQINLLARGERVEKLCVVKDGRPWLKKGMRLHAFDPWRGFTGEVMRSGQTLVVKDIWCETWRGEPNPFLALAPGMHPKYLEDVKQPVASLMIVPVLRGKEVFATVEFGRYRGRPPFRYAERSFVERFAAQYAALIMEYLVDVKARAATHIAHKRLINMARLVATNQPVDYQDAVTAYVELSAAEIGLAFIKAGRLSEHDYRLVAWRGDDVRELLLEDFAPARDSILWADGEQAFPLEGQGDDGKLQRFAQRALTLDGLQAEERDFLRVCLDDIRSYLVYPLHMLGQDLGVVMLAASRERFWPYLYLSPFLSLYTSLLKSFLLNERLAQLLSGVSRRVHNPGFYCLGELKTALATRHPETLRDPGVLQLLGSLGDLFEELHSRGAQLGWRSKRIHLVSWLNAFVSQSLAVYPGLAVVLEIREGAADCVVLSSEEQLDVIFENLLSNSLRAIQYRQASGFPGGGTVTLEVWFEGEGVHVCVSDDGTPYPSVSGHGVPQIEAIVKEVGGTFCREEDPYRTQLMFPCANP